MKNTAVNTLTYTGIVTISQYIGAKKVKIAQKYNTGGTTLFDFLSDCLCGDWTLAKAKRPTKIKVLEWSQDGQNRDYKSISGFIFLRNPPEKVEDQEQPNQSRVRYSFLIPRDMFENISGTRGLGLGLYASGALETEPGNFSAFCELDELGQNLTSLSNSSLVVDWELVIANKPAGT